jgi:hypothetical protein
MGPYLSLSLFILLILHLFSDACLILSEKSKIDVNSTSEYVIKIYCTDGIDTTFFDLALLFTTKDPAVTEKPDSQSDSTPIIIGVSIGGLFLILIVVIIVVFVRKRQHKNNDESRVYETTLPLSDIDGSNGHHYESVFQTGRS